MPLSDDTAALQERLAQMCRNGQVTALPGAPKQRTQVYRDLVFGNICATLERAYPVMHSLLSKLPGEQGMNSWKWLITELVAKFPLQSPEFWKMPRDLMEFINTEALSEKLALPFLSDLARFEWIEIELYMMPERPREIGRRTRDRLLGGTLNPDYILERFSYPVFKTKPLDLPRSPADYFLLGFRHIESCAVRFVELSPLSALIHQELCNEQTDSFDPIGALENALSRVGAAISRDELAAELERLCQIYHSEGMILS